MVRQYPSLPVLLVDDEAEALQSFEITLRSGGINNCLSCQKSEEVLPLLAEREIEVLLLDLWMPQVSGEEILSEVSRHYPELPVIIVTGVNEVEMAVRCMKSGVFDYLVKPVERNRLVTVVRRAIELRDLRRENSMLKDRVLSGKLEHPEAFAEIVTGNEAMLSLFRYAEAIAVTSQPVLITGETGVGKELIARAIHRLSRLSGEFVPVDVAGLDDMVFSDTLFGHRKGAFTGAEGTRAGLVEKAGGGTLFLDEIGDLSAGLQVKLLRLLQEREYRPLGSDVAKRTDARVIVATNRDVQRLMHDGAFRKDLYYRLCTHHIHIPPLKERSGDVSLLLDHFLEEAAGELGRKKPTPPKELDTLLGTYSFPGNVRELRSMVFDAVSSHRAGMLSMGAFKQAIDQQAAVARGGAGGPDSSLSVDGEGAVVFAEQLPTLKEAETLLIDEALRRAQGNQAIAARMLGITRQALNRRLRNSER